MSKINVLSLGAGVQSSALVYLAHSGKIPKYDKIIFADTGDEPEKVYKHLEYLKTLESIEIVSVGKLSDYIYNPTYKFASLPFYVVLNNEVSILRRQCTAEFKIRPVDLAIRKYLNGLGLAKENKLGRIRVNYGVQINLHLGISTDEYRRVSKSRVNWKQHQYPLIELGFTRHDCLKFAIENGYKKPPKSSCIYCPYHDASYWNSLTDVEIEQACKLDDYIRSAEFKAQNTSIRGDLFIHSSCVPLRDVVRNGFNKSKSVPVQLSFAAELLEQTCKSDNGFSCFS